MTAKPLILVVEDTPELGRAIQLILQRSGFQVVVVTTAGEGLSEAASQKYAACIIDIGLPDFSGLELMTRVRELGITTPALFLTTRNSVAYRIAGLDAGADDYLPKPFSPRELPARVRALVRRGTRPKPRQITVLDATLDPVRRTLHREQQQVHLTDRECALLMVLMRYRGQPVSREQLSTDVWHQPFDPFTNVIDVHITKLRKKLRKLGLTRVIKTIRGTGYQLNEPKG